MKLKKIASLMLAGIMAVSMLAGCGEGKGNSNSGSSSSENPVASSFTEAVLAEASKATNDNVTVNPDTTLDKAIEWAAKNNKYDTQEKELTRLDKTARLVIDANTVMDNLDDYDDVAMENWNFSDSATIADRTLWVMYIVDNVRTDEWIAKELAADLDEISDNMVQDNCEYSIRIAKADVTTDSDSFGGSVVIGVAITVDLTTNNH